MKRALITSGGGAKGAFTVGAINFLAQENIHFDIISGTSTGSFIAALVAADEITALTDQYLHVSNNDILQMNNIVNNLLQKRPFLFDTHPLLELIKIHISDHVFSNIMKPEAPTLCITAISLQTGLPTVFCNRDISRDLPADRKYNIRVFKDREEMILSLLASGSQAAFTKPVDITINGVTEQFVDGGHRDVIPSRVVVDLAPDLLYILSNNPGEQSVRSRRYDNVLDILFRAIGMFIQDVRESDLKIIDDFAAATNAKYFRIEPPFDLDEEHPTGLFFDPTQMADWMNMGRHVAEAAINEPAFPRQLVPREPPIV